MGTDSWLGIENLLNLTLGTFKKKLDEHNSYSCVFQSIELQI